MAAIEKTFYGTSAVNIKSKALTASGAVSAVPGVIWGFSSDGDGDGTINDAISGAVLAYVHKGDSVFFGKPIEASTSIYWTRVGGKIVVYYE